MQRPLVKWFLSAVGGLIVAYYLPVTKSLILTIGIMITSIIIIILIKSVAKTHFLMLFLICLVFLFHLQIEKLAWQQSEMKEILGKQSQLSGIIKKIVKKKNNKEYTIKAITNLRTQQQYKYKIKLMIWRDKNELDLGDKVVFTTKLKYPSKQKNPGGFSYRKYLQKRGIYAIGSINSKEITKIRGHENYIVTIVNFMRDKIRSIVQKYFKGENQKIVNTLILGVKEEVPSEIISTFQRLGVSHLLVISGFHIGLVSYLIYLIIKYIGLSAKSNAIVVTLFLIFYLALINWQIPALRAALLVVLTLVANVLNRKVDLYNILSGIALMLLLVNPWSLFTVSFQLSFTAVIMINYLSPIIKRGLLFLPDKLGEIIAATLAVQIGLLPILIFYFHQVSLLSILTNLILMPLISSTLVLILILIVGDMLSVYFIEILAVLIKILLNLSLNIVQFLAEHWNIIFNFASPSLTILIFYYIIVYYGAKIFQIAKVPYNNRFYKRLIVVILSLIIVIVTVGFEENKYLKLVFLSVGLGDGIYMQTPNKQNVLIDCGSTGRGTINFLKEQGVTKVDLIFISHFHKDHAGGIIEILQQFEVDRICYPSTGDNKIKLKLDKLINHQNIDTKISVLTAGDKVSIAKVNFLVLNPTSKLIKESHLNNSSLVLKMIYKQFEVLFTGDIEKEAETALINNGFDLKADVLKVAHHGSDSSSTSKFLKKVTPCLSVISVGENKHGLPDNSVLFKLEKLGIENLRTDQQGAITINSDGETYNYQTYLKK